MITLEQTSKYIYFNVKLKIFSCVMFDKGGYVYEEGRGDYSP